MLHKFRNFVIPTGKKTLTVFFHTIFPSESFGRSGFSTVWVFRPLFPAEQAKGRDLKGPAPALGSLSAAAVVAAAVVVAATVAVVVAAAATAAVVAAPAASAAAEQHDDDQDDPDAAAAAAAPAIVPTAHDLSHLTYRIWLILCAGGRSGTRWTELFSMRS